ncbi:MAG: outer membrane beta-barrel protein [Chitinivibrionales bacterium]
MKHHFNFNGKIMRSNRLFALLFCAMIPLSTYSADDVGSSVGLNSKAVLFSFDGLSTLRANAFDGGFGAKYFLTDVLALRGSLQFSTASQTITPATPPGPGQVETDGSNSATQLGLSVAAEYHLLKTRVSPYVGGGIGFSSTSTQLKSAGNATPPAVYTQTIVKDIGTGTTIAGVPYDAGFDFGVGGLAGIEFFITKEVSLSAEYQLGYSLNSPYDQQTTTGAVTTTTKEGGTSTFGISSAGILTLAIYF